MGSIYSESYGPLKMYYTGKNLFHLCTHVKPEDHDFDFGQKSVLTNSQNNILTILSTNQDSELPYF